MRIVVAQRQEKRLDFKWDGGFTPSFEKAVRDTENFGRRLDDRAIMPESNRLKEAYGWFHGKTGLTCQFIWEDGTKQAFVHLDAPKATGEVESFTKAIEYFFGGDTGVKLLNMRSYDDNQSTIGAETTA